jgi:cobalamin biosynthesis protein CobD/CbiB
VVASSGGAHRAGISWGDHHLRSAQPRTGFLNGLVLAVCVTMLAAEAVWVTISLCGLVSHWLSYLAAVLVAWTTLAMRGLDDAAKTVELGLRRDDENAAGAGCRPWLAAIPTSAIGSEFARRSSRLPRT